MVRFEYAGWGDDRLEFWKEADSNGNPGSPHGGMDLPAPRELPCMPTQRGRVALAEELFFSGKR